MEPWHDFFIGAAGAAASLAGLLIVALSVNVRAILKAPGVPARAAATVAGVAVTLATAVSALIPSQPAWTFAAQVIVFTLVALVLHVRALHLAFRQPVARTAAMKAARVLGGPVPVVPFLAGGLVFIPASGPGLALIAAGTILTLLMAIETGWVLLIEILR